MQKVILGITAHADDNTTFAGTIMKLQDAGYDYVEALVTDSSAGDSTKAISDKTDTKKIRAVRNAEFAKAMHFLNCEKVYELQQEDQNLQYTKALMHTLVGIIREVRPTIGITMNTVDVHPDHIAAATLAREAFRWAAKQNFLPELGPAYRTTTVLFAEGTLPINAAILVDITKYYHRKEELFAVYESQASNKDIAIMKSFATIRGYHLRKPDSQFAEAFSVEQHMLPILFEDIGDA